MNIDVSVYALEVFGMFLDMLEMDNFKFVKDETEEAIEMNKAFDEARVVFRNLIEESLKED
ncbi:MAG: hypothetical protein ACRCTZ_21825 [Sarcina sp.]